MKKLVIAIVIIVLSSNVMAGEITNANVWLNRCRSADLSYQECGFYTDIWGTVEQFSSISFMSPAGNNYSLSEQE